MGAGRGAVVEKQILILLCRHLLGAGGAVSAAELARLHCTARLQRPCVRLTVGSMRGAQAKTLQRQPPCSSAAANFFAFVCATIFL